MAQPPLRRIKNLIRLGHFDMTQHAVEEMAEDMLDLGDIETAILNGMLTKIEKNDPRGWRYTIHGTGIDGATPVGCVGRFTASGRYLIITAYEVTDE